LTAASFPRPSHEMYLRQRRWNWSG